MSGPDREVKRLLERHNSTWLLFAAFHKETSKYFLKKVSIKIRLLHLIFTGQSTKVDIHSGLTQPRQVLTFSALPVSSLVVE